MLRWCAYCQQFQGEVAPFDELLLTHGICPTCEADWMRISDDDIAGLRVLQEIHQRLMEAGWNRDLATAERVVIEAKDAGFRPVDILLGAVTSLLHQVGEAWKRAEMTVEEEHRFTAFCDALFARIAARSDVAEVDPSIPDERPNVLLLNAIGNRHSLGFRLIDLWLRGQGARLTVMAPSARLEDVIEAVRQIEPQLVMISMGLAEQRAHVVRLVEQITAMAVQSSPRILIGGHAVKLGLVAPIPGAELTIELPKLKGSAWAQRPAPQ